MEEKGQTYVPDELIRETDRFWEDPEKIMRLIDLLFLWEDNKKNIPS